MIEPESNGILVPFFAVDELAERVIEALQNPVKFALVRDAARRYVIEHFDAERVCIPQMRRLLQPQGMASLTEIPDEPRSLSEGIAAPGETSDRDQREERIPAAKDVLRNPFA